ncbi:MAG: lipid-binding SYLF domain-containing protein [Terracidiphilus sp.]
MKMTSLLLIGTLTLTTGTLWGASGRQDSIERLRLSADVLHAAINAADKGIPEEVVRNAKCIVVVPHLVKGGFIIGGEHGRGVAICRTAEGWSAPAFVSIGGGSWGLQIGAEAVDLVMLAMNDQGLQHLLSSKFKIGGDASASAGPVGRHASAGTDWKLNTEMLTYSRSRGAFVGISLDGAVVEPDADSTRAIYGGDPAFRAILSGNVRAPKSTLSFKRAVAEIAHTSAAAEK